MNININNYEEWMVDYIEGSLTKVQQEQLLHFMEIHPELKAELEAFQHTKLQPDLSVVFANKEMLKKKEAGRVIAMGNWGKYAIGIAAALMLFIGVKLYNSTNSSISGKQYSAKQIENPVYALKPTDSSVGIIADDKIHLTDSSERNLYADVKHNQHHQLTLPIDSSVGQDENVAANKIYQHIIDIQMATDAVEMASIEKLDFVKHRGRIERDMNESNMQYIYATYVAPYQENTENNSIIDKYNNTMAFAESIGSLLGLGKEEEAKKTTDDDVKETHIKIFDIEYYNRKKTDK